MFTQTPVTQSLAPVGTVPVPLSRPPNQPRKVERSGQSELREQQSATTRNVASGGVERLSNAARQFAELLDSTGNIRLAMALSGFRPGQVDVYA